MRYRKLRIAWSVVCGMLCLLLILLWVRSYWRFDYLCRLNRTPVYIGIESDTGLIALTWIDLRLRPRATQNLAPGWTHSVLRPAVADNTRRRFQLASMSGFLQVVFPHWLLVIPTAAAATSPWLPRSFSLRTLLIATTLVAVVLGLIVAVL